MSKLQKKLSKQILELLFFTDSWNVAHDDNKLKLLTTDSHSIAIIKGEPNYIEPNGSNVDKWEMYKLKYNKRDLELFNTRCDKILNR